MSKNDGWHRSGRELRSAFFQSAPRNVFEFKGNVFQEMMTGRFGALFSPLENVSKVVVVNFIVAGMIETFRKYESFCEESIEAMPLHVADIFSET